MWPFNSIKPSPENGAPNKPVLSPVYTNIVSHANVSKLKLDMIKEVSTMQPKIVLSDADKAELIRDLIDQLPKMLKDAIAKDKKDVEPIYFFGSSISVAHHSFIANNGGYDIVFNQLWSDLAAVLKSIGITPVQADSTCVRTTVGELKRFCNCDKLLALTDIK